MKTYQIEFSIKFNAINEGESDYKEHEFFDVMDIEAESFEEAEENLYEMYDNNMDDVMSSECHDCYYSAEHTEEDAVYISTVNLIDGDAGDDNIIHIKYPDDSDGYPSKVGDKYVKYYATIWDEEKYNTDDDYEPDEIPVFD
jgi:hypothetical protein